MKKSKLVNQRFLYFHSMLNACWNKFCGNDTETEFFKGLFATILSAYVHTYIKEEIEEEGIVNNIELLIRFMEAAGIVNGQVLNKVKIAKTQKLPPKFSLKITMQHGNFQTNDDKTHAVNCKDPSSHKAVSCYTACWTEAVRKNNACERDIRHERRELF
ncbi:MAG TPA: hypothetical protein ACFYEH_00905 [Candidatus Brocadiaceae bacterium]